MEQVVAPAPVEQRQLAGVGVLGAERVQAQQGVHAALLAGAQVALQAFERGLQAGRGGVDQAPAGGGIQQQVGDQPGAGGAPGQALRLVVGDQPLQLRAGPLQQQGEAFVEAPLAVQRRRHAVEAHQRMQAEAGQRGAPVGLAVAGAGDEVEHRQQRPRAVGEHRQFVAVLGQHRLAGVDHVQPGVAGQQLAQHLGLLLEAPARLGAGQQPGDARRAVEAFGGWGEQVEVVAQGDGVLQAGGVVEFEQRLAVH